MFGRLRAIHFESVVVNLKKCMLTLQNLLRSKPKLNSGTTHIFWYMMDEHMCFWCHPENACLHCFRELFLEYAYIIVKLWV